MKKEDVYEILIKRNAINKRVKQIAKEIDKYFYSQSLTILCVLKGSFIFAADLVRLLEHVKCNIEFIELSSYGSERFSSGEIEITKSFGFNNLTDENVLIVEDIIDSGLTLDFLVYKIKHYDPKELKTCVLLDKKCKRKIDFIPDYSCFEIDDKFVIGYGLDDNESFRELPDIYWVKN